jgi:hypothetical protein
MRNFRYGFNPIPIAGWWVEKRCTALWTSSQNAGDQKLTIRDGWLTVSRQSVARSYLGARWASNKKSTGVCVFFEKPFVAS